MKQLTITITINRYSQKLATQQKTEETHKTRTAKNMDEGSPILI